MRTPRSRPPQAAAGAMRGEGIALPFPGGIVRSGSKVGALTSKSMPASTNHQLAPTLRAQVEDSLVPDGVGALFEIVIDGVSEDAVREAMRRGLHARRRRRRDARHRRQLRRQAGRVPLPAVRAARPAVTLTLTLRTQPPARVDAAPLIPERLRGLHSSARSPRSRCAAAASRRPSATCSRCRATGTRSRSWCSPAICAGSTGSALGMSSGEVEVRGDVGAWAGAEMAGGVLRIFGDAGAPARGCLSGRPGGDDRRRDRRRRATPARRPAPACGGAWSRSAAGPAPVPGCGCSRAR